MNNNFIFRIFHISFHISSAVLFLVFTYFFSVPLSLSVTFQIIFAVICFRDIILQHHRRGHGQPFTAGRRSLLHPSTWCCQRTRAQGPIVACFLYFFFPVDLFCARSTHFRVNCSSIIIVFPRNGEMQTAGPFFMAVNTASSLHGAFRARRSPSWCVFLSIDRCVEMRSSARNVSDDVFCSKELTAVAVVGRDPSAETTSPSIAYRNECSLGWAPSPNLDGISV